MLDVAAVDDDVGVAVDDTAVGVVAVDRLDGVLAGVDNALEGGEGAADDAGDHGVAVVVLVGTAAAAVDVAAVGGYDEERIHLALLVRRDGAFFILVVEGLDTVIHAAAVAYLAIVDGDVGGAGGMTVLAAAEDGAVDEYLRVVVVGECRRGAEGDMGVVEV